MDEHGVEAKLEILSKIKEGRLSLEELAYQTTLRRLDWLCGNDMGSHYAALEPLERAYRIIFLEHLRIKQTEHKLIWQPGRLIVRSRNPCPYLVACQELGLDTRVICRALEGSFGAMTRIIDRRLSFSRNYARIRPYTDFCEEYFELKAPISQSKPF